MRSLVFFAVLVGTVAVMPAHAQTDSRGAPKYNRIELQQFYGYQLKELREEALRRKAAEGGTISSISLADLQGQLDRINAGRIRDAKRNDSWSVDAFGRSTRPKD